jgi:hypothetical protein
MKIEPKEYRNLECKLTDDELREKAADVATKRKQANELKAAKKSNASAYKTQIDALDAEIDHGCSVIREKVEARSVECRWIRDDVRKMMACVRTDTGALVDSRQMSDKERQAELFEEPKVEAAPAPTADAAPPAKKRGRPAKSKAAEQANGSAHPAEAKQHTLDEAAQ